MARGPRTDATGQIQRPSNGAGEQAGEERQTDLAKLTIKTMGGEISRALPKHLDAGRMSRIVLTALKTTKNLNICDPGSFFGCVLQTSQLGLEPNTPLQHSFLIPREKRDRAGRRTGNYYCTLIIGYQGMIDLAYRSGRVQEIYAHEVREGDRFHVRYGLHRDLKHEPSDDPKRHTQAITHVYAVADLGDSRRAFVVLNRGEIDQRKGRSESVRASRSPWKSDETAMILKTGVRALYRWLPKSPEMARAEAIGVAEELGQSSVSSLDPDLAQALQSHGMLPESTEDTETLDDAMPAETLDDAMPAEEAEKEKVPSGE